MTQIFHQTMNGLYFKHANRESLGTILVPGPLYRAGKILIYANQDYHKLHFPTSCLPEEIQVTLVHGNT